MRQIHGNVVSLIPARLGNMKGKALARLLYRIAAVEAEREQSFLF
jgi:hypothetical protein